MVCRAVTATAREIPVDRTAVGRGEARAISPAIVPNQLAAAHVIRGRSRLAGLSGPVIVPARRALAASAAELVPAVGSIAIASASGRIVNRAGSAVCCGQAA